MRQQQITAEDDFAELYVLMRVLQRTKKSRVGLARIHAGKAYFVVATAPSPNWNAASHFVTAGAGATVALRTGLEVFAPDTGTVEFDVVLVEASKVANNHVSDAGLLAALEVKNHTRRLSSTVADLVRGKASRIHVPLPVRDAGDTSRTSRYCLVAREGVSQNGMHSITSAGIANCDFGPTLDAYLAKLLSAFAM